jgi:hypothetical protein
MNKIVSNWWPSIGLFLGLSLAFNVMQRGDIKSLNESKGELVNTLKTLNTERDSLRLANDSISIVLTKYEYLTDSLDVLVEGQKEQIKWLKIKLGELETEIDNMIPDSVYLALKEQYTCADSIDIYGFSECETVNIYKDISKIPVLTDIIATQDSVVTKQAITLDLRQKMIGVLQEDNRAKTNLLERLYVDLANNAIQLDMSETENKRLRKTLRMWQTGSIGVGGALLLILLIL